MQKKGATGRVQTLNESHDGSTRKRDERTGHVKRGIYWPDDGVLQDACLTHAPHLGGLASYTKDIT